MNTGIGLTPPVGEGSVGPRPGTGGDRWQGRDRFLTAAAGQQVHEEEADEQHAEHAAADHQGAPVTRGQRHLQAPPAAASSVGPGTEPGPALWSLVYSTTLACSCSRFVTVVVVVSEPPPGRG